MDGLDLCVSQITADTDGGLLLFIILQMQRKSQHAEMFQFVAFYISDLYHINIFTFLLPHLKRVHAI